MNDSEPTSWSLRTFPWATLATAALAITCFTSPTFAGLLAYDRLHIMGGEAWRILTGNWVHFSGRELGWNLAVLLPAGVWAERLQPLRARILYVVAPLLVGGLLYGAFPEVARFAGLSGVAAAVVAFLALTQLRVSDTDRWFWRLVLGLLALKIGAEAVVASRWVTPVPDPAARAVPLIHLAGVTAASLVRTLRRRVPRKGS